MFTVSVTVSIIVRHSAVDWTAATGTGFGGLLVIPKSAIVGPIGGSMRVMVEGFVAIQPLSASETSTVTLGKPEKPCASTVAGPWEVEPCKAALSGSGRALSDGLLLAGKFPPAAPLKMKYSVSQKDLQFPAAARLVRTVTSAAGHLSELASS